MFVPTDEDFYHLTNSDHNRLAKFSIEEKYKFVKAHILASYYTLPALHSSVPYFSFPTLATLDMGPGTFLLSISDINGTFLVDTGIVRGIITRTIYDHEPNVIYEVSMVLLPPELFRPKSLAPPVIVSSAVSPPLPMFHCFLFLFLVFYC
jgi:hypothetical protein